MTSAVTILGLALGVSAAAVIWSAVSDVRAYVIPNSASLLIAGAYLVVAIFTPYSHLGGGLIAGAGSLALGLGLFAFGWMGGGDVKLFSALALWCGPTGLPAFLIITALAGAALALVMLSPLRRLAPHPSPEAAATAARPMPYGVAIATGGIWALAQYARLVI